MSDRFTAASGRSVVSRTSAEQLGELAHVVVDANLRRVALLVVGKRRKALLVAWDQVSGFGPDAEWNIGEGNSASRVFGAEVMTNAFSTLDLIPAAGHFFSPQDAAAVNEPVVVLSYGYWREHFAASPEAVGQTLRIDGISRRVIGVMPAGVRFPYEDTQFVTPVTFKTGDALDPWQQFDLRAFGRLKADANPSSAQAELRQMQKLLLPLFPWRAPPVGNGRLPFAALWALPQGVSCGNCYRKAWSSVHWPELWD